MAGFPLFVEIEEDEGGDGEEVQKVHADGKAHQEADQHYPAVGIRLVRLFVPFGHRPEDQGGEQ